MLRPFNFCDSSSSFSVWACDLWPFDFLVTGPVACHFRFDFACEFCNSSLSFSLRSCDFWASSLSFWLRPCDLCVSSSYIHLYLLVLVPAARHFRFDLAILNLSIFGPKSRHFRFDIAIFAPLANRFRLNLANIYGRSSSFFPRPWELWTSILSFSLRPCNFVSVALHFCLDLAIFGLVACYFY